MKLTPRNKKILAGLFLLIILLSVGGYFIFKGGGGGDVECDENQRKYGNKCVPKCTVDQDPCGPVCIDKNTQKCIDGNVCAEKDLCNGDTECCSEGEKCNPYTNSCIECDTDIFCDDGCCEQGEICLSGRCCKKQKKCGLVCCLDNQRCNSEGNCIDCSDDDILCGKSCCHDGQTCLNSDICCDPLKICGENCCLDGESCMTNKTCCKTINICGENCCKDGETCNHGQCCNPDNVCGENCCKDGEVCNNGACCPPEKSCGDEGCCETNCCGTDKKCCETNEVCHQDKCVVSCGSEYCDPNSQICVQTVDQSGKTVSACKNKTGCSWKELTYDPADIMSVQVCQNNDGLYASHYPAEGVDLPYNRTATSSMDPNQKNCTTGNCFDRINEAGLEFVSWDGEVCTGKFKCADKLPSAENQPNCPFPGGDSRSCCLNEKGEFTGQVCKAGQTCFNGVCGYGWKVKDDVSQGPIGCVVQKEAGIPPFNTEEECKGSLTSCGKNPLFPTWPGPPPECTESSGSWQSCEIVYPGSTKCETENWACKPGNCKFTFPAQFPSTGTIVTCSESGTAKGSYKTAVKLKGNAHPIGTQKGGAWDSGLCKPGNYFIKVGGDSWCCGPGDTDCLNSIPTKFILSDCSTKSNPPIAPPSYSHSYSYSTIGIL